MSYCESCERNVERADKAEAEVERLKQIPVRLESPDAEELRALDGDDSKHDRYWMGWTDALDEVRREVEK